MSSVNLDPDPFFVGFPNMFSTPEYFDGKGRGTPRSGDDGARSRKARFAALSTSCGLCFRVRASARDGSANVSPVGYCGGDGVRVTASLKNSFGIVNSSPKARVRR